MTVWGNVWWLVGTALVGFASFVVYAFAASPILETCHGGMASSVTVAAVIGLLLLSAAAVAVWRYHQPLWVSFFGFVAAYGVTLLALAEVSPVIWGPRHCNSVGFF
jgi:hypothetical protein